jgi:predicted DNA-binding transcriptional regulator
MYQETLEGLGLSPNEAKIYETLVEHGELGVSEIATRAQIHRRNAYDAIRRLIDKGLCFEILSQKENLYNAVDPGKLLELTEEKRQSIEAILPDLNKKFLQRTASEEAFIYKGYEGQKNIWREILRVGKDIHIIGAKAQWFDPKLDAPRAAFYRETKRKKMKFHLLYDSEIKTQLPSFAKEYPGFVEYRWLPKESSSTAIIVIFGDYVVMYAGVGIMKMSENTVFFVIKSSELAEGYRTWFKNIWAQAKGN